MLESLLHDAHDRAMGNSHIANVYIHDPYRQLNMNGTQPVMGPG
jgi:hypothetical protein